MKSEEGDGDDGLHGQRVGAQRVGQVAAEQGDGGAEQREDQHPQQHGAFVVPPHAGDLVEQRLGRMRVGPHVLDREVGRDVGVRERAEGDGEQRELRERGRLGDLHQAGIAGVRAPGRQRHLHQRHGEREDERRNVRARRSWVRLRIADAIPLPACGEGLGVGGVADGQCSAIAPLPGPPPQGGGDDAVRAFARMTHVSDRHFCAPRLWSCRRLQTPCSLRALATSGGM